MAEDDTSVAAPQPANRRFPVRKVALGIGAVLIGLVLLIGLLLLGLNTSPGKRFLVSQIQALKLESGMAIDMGRIDGSIYGDMVIHDLILRDTKGVFAVSPEVRVTWSPFQYLRSHIDVRSVTSPLIGRRCSMRRRPIPTRRCCPISTSTLIG